jgi:ArsR family transcriptional regulator
MLGAITRSRSRFVPFKSILDTGCWLVYSKSTMNDQEQNDNCLPSDELVTLDHESCEEESELARIAKALGHPIRVKILRILLQRKACLCGEIVAEVPVAQATVSQHLKVLKEAGLIQGEIDGPRVCYCANFDQLHRFVGLVSWLVNISSLSEKEVN